VLREGQPDGQGRQEKGNEKNAVGQQQPACMEGAREQQIGIKADGGILREADARGHGGPAKKHQHGKDPVVASRQGRPEQGQACSRRAETQHRHGNDHIGEVMPLGDREDLHERQLKGDHRRRQQPDGEVRPCFHNHAPQIDAPPSKFKAAPAGRINGFS